jgi:hypothetical protein
VLMQNKLRQMVQVNRLEAMYPPQVLQNVFAKLDRVDFRWVFMYLPPKTAPATSRSTLEPTLPYESTTSSVAPGIPPGCAQQSVPKQ